MEPVYLKNDQLENPNGTKKQQMNSVLAINSLLRLCETMDFALAVKSENS